MSAALAIDLVSLTPWYLFAAEALRTTDLEKLRRWIPDLREAEGWDGAPGASCWDAALGHDGLALEREYVRLFLHPAGAVCPPWQSVHGDEPALMGPSHHGALAWYARLGLVPPEAGEAADHAGLLLGFYALLLAAETGDCDLDRFANAHLRWMDAFGSRLAAEARHPFYMLLGNLVRQLAAVSG